MPPSTAPAAEPVSSAHGSDGLANEAKDADADFNAFLAECERYETIERPAALQFGALHEVTARSTDTRRVPQGGLAGASQTTRHSSHQNAGISGTAGSAAAMNASVHSMQARRVQSAPGLSGLTFLPLEIVDTSEFLDVDADWSPDEWLVASVKTKAAARQQRNAAHTFQSQAMPSTSLQQDTVGSTRHVEDWDEDFDMEDDETKEMDCDAPQIMTLSIPKVVDDLQSRLKSDILSMQKFALHIQDLKLIYLDVLDLQCGLESSKKLGGCTTLSELIASHRGVLEASRVMIDIAETSDDTLSTTAPVPRLTSRHIQVLAAIITREDAFVVDGGNGGDVGGLEGKIGDVVIREGDEDVACVSSDTMELLHKMVQDGVFVFQSGLFKQ
eukprot:jgi/Hompol1/5884/HPOL_000183-RA